MIKIFLDIVDRIDTDFKENIVKTSIVFLVLVTTFLLSENIFLSFVVGTFVAILFLNWDSRVFIGVGLIFLISCPIILAFGERAASGQMAIYAYYMLAVGVVLQILKYCLQYFLEGEGSKKTESIKLGFGNNKKIIISSVIGATILLIFVIYLFSGYSKFQNNLATKTELNQMGSVGFAMDNIINNQQKMSGVDTDGKNADSKNIKDADWDTTKVLVENATEREGLEEKVAEKFRKLGKSGVFTTKTLTAPSEKTLIRYCPGCMGIVIKLLSIMNNFEKADLVEDPDLADEVRIILGADQIGINYGDITISVLNGSSVGGVARQLGNNMTKDGFKLINVGSADRKDYNKTIIKYAPVNIKKASALQEYLVDLYNNIGMIEDASITPTVDAEIIIGTDQ